MSFLKGLPSKGTFTTPKQHKTREIPRYVCDHETRIPEEEQIHCDQTSILMRSLCAASTETTTTKSFKENFIAEQKCQGRQRFLMVYLMSVLHPQLEKEKKK